MDGLASPRPPGRSLSIAPSVKPRWDAMAAKVAKRGDATGMGIDRGISNTVIALNLLGVPTSSSCEGHIERGLPAPWVEIGKPRPAAAYRLNYAVRDTMRRRLGVVGAHIALVEFRSDARARQGLEKLLADFNSTR